MTKLRIAQDLALPIETVTQAIGIVAKRRVGKSYTARRLAEQLLHAKQQVVMVDPKGDWWGIRSSADGKAPGFPVVILGGEHKDVPLEVSAGEVVAKIVVEERVSALLDLSEFRKREVARFMADFLETLYRLKAKEALRTPVMVIIDEADAIAPQKPQEGEERMLGAAEDIVRRGGQRGIGCTMITQRTAVLNKNVLTQCEMLVALRTISPQDLKAMQAWIDVHGSIEERDTLMASLPSLPQGDAWFWSPGWPTAEGIFKRVHVLEIETFDSGATPKAGEKPKEPKTVADVDLGALERQMAATIEKAKADDPRELRKQIAQLQKENRELARGVGELSSAKHILGNLDHEYRRGIVDGEQRGRVAAMRDLQRIIAKDLNALDAGICGSYDRIGDAVEALKQLRATLSPVHEEPDPASRATHVDRRTQSMQKPAARSTARPPVAHRSDTDLPAGAQKLLNAARRLEAVNIETPTRAQVAALAPMSPTSSATDRHFAACTRAGYLEVAEGGRVRLTDAGRAAAAPAGSPSTLDEYIAEWQRLLGADASRKLFDAYVAWPQAPAAIARADLAELAGISATSSATDRGFAWLTGLELLVVAGSGQVKAGPTMFPEGLT